MIVHCLFEQSGIFKNAFKKLGFEAYDYDIDNQFGQTDYQIDLFTEIKNYQREGSIFDNFSTDDLIIAFFPCIRFSANILLNFTGNNYGMRNWSIERKLKNSKRLSEEQSYFYGLFCDLFLIAYENNFRLIVENPTNDAQGYLNMHFPIQPSLVDYDRRVLGDKFKKPTQYWFINLPVSHNHLNNQKQFNFGYNKVFQNSDIAHTSKGIQRSLIEQKYAENFIQKYILN